MWDARGRRLWRKPHPSERCGASTSPYGSASPRRGLGQLDGVATQQETQPTPGVAGGLQGTPRC